MQIGGKKLLILINDKEQAKNMGRYAREFIIEKFNWEIVAKRFVDVVTDYLKDNKNSVITK